MTGSATSGYKSFLAMKKLLILLSIFFLQNQTYGQVEFAPEGAEWCFKTAGGFLPYYGNMQCAVSSDTIVQGKDSKVIECSTVGYLDMPCCDTTYWQGHFIVHQSGDSIFNYTDFSGFKFLFRNDLTLGEVTVFPELYSYPLKVEEVESGTIGNVTVKNFKLHDEVNDIFASNLYDRIGPDKGFFEHWDASSWDGGSFFLRWYKDSDIDTLFVASEPCGVFPVSTLKKDLYLFRFLQIQLMTFCN